MKTITASLSPVSSVEKQDADLFIQWAYEQRAETDFDPDVITYPRACMLNAKRDGQTVAMVPMHPVLMVESFIKDKNLTKTQRAATLFRLGELLESVAKDSGHGECFFITNDKAEARMCQKHKDWQIVMHDSGKGTWLMRKKVCK